MNIIPEVIFDKIILYNSTRLCDIYKSRLKINGLMVLFRLQNGKYMRLWHCMGEVPRYGIKWSENIDKKYNITSIVKWVWGELLQV